MIPSKLCKLFHNIGYDKAKVVWCEVFGYTKSKNQYKNYN